MRTKWDIFQCPIQLRDQLSAQLGVVPLIAQLLIKRGITTPEKAERFLSPSLRDLADPFLLKDMERAVERIVRAVRDEETILVYGDYDVDGMTSCALMVEFLGSLGVKTSYYIPHRLQEGYGLNSEAVKRIAGEGVNLLICVDCGVSDLEEIDLARQLGMDTIVVDHHEVPERLPDACAIINPMQPDCAYPFKGLAGVGVAFNFVMALRRRLRELEFWLKRPEPNLLRHLDLVALGTIADVAPLLDVNRICVKYGLKEVEHTDRPGLVALKKVSRLGAGDVSVGHVAFRLTPRLNAAGRMTDPSKGMELLLARDNYQARKIAEELDQANQQRQRTEEKTLREAKEMIVAQNLLKRKSFVLSSDQWHPGVIGIVASRLTEEFCRPTILIAFDGDKGKGSARSIGQFHLYDGLKPCGEYLLGFGGHKYAAGITISREQIRTFDEAFEKVVQESLGNEDLSSSIAIDAEVDLAEITPQLMRDLSLFTPHGVSNPRPLFASRNQVAVNNVRPVGADSVKFDVEEGGVTHETIGFGMVDLEQSLPSAVKIAFHPRINDWDGSKKLQLELRAVETRSDG